MSHKTFKVCILNDQLVENFYIKHYIDEIQPVFERFKNQVFRRNPSINTVNLRTYWIDSENDEILIACEEDFRVFLEVGQGKVYFSLNNSNHQEPNGEIAMEAEEIQSTERGSRKGKRDEEKHRRHAKKLADKLKRLEETCLKVEGKSVHHSEKREYKHAERMEKAKRRVEQIRAIIGSIDPANLNSSTESQADVNIGASTSKNETVAAEVSVPSPETIRLLSGAIAGCLQPCSLINKILNDVIGMIPQMETPPPYTEGDRQQSNLPESPRPSSTTQATNTSYVNTPNVNTPIAVQASHEIEALFKEAAKELEKMNEIVNNTTKTVMETSTTSTATTQFENSFANISDSGTSNATVINAPDKSKIDGAAANPMDLAISMLDEEFKSITPSKSIRSRESSIEVHDVNSLMSDDSRDWTIVDQDEMSIDNIAPSNTPSRIVEKSTGAIPKYSTSTDNASQVNLAEQEVSTGAKHSSDNYSQVDMPQVSIETQTPTSLLSNETKMELQASVQKSIDIVQKSLETIQKTMENASTAAATQSQNPQALLIDVSNEASAIPSVTPANASAPPYGFLYPKINQQQEPPVNEAARRGGNKTLTVKFEPAVVVYDPNPKINAAVHTMMNMGFNNEGNWLTQLLINVDGDVQKAINFLTPQPKPNKNK